MEEAHVEVSDVLTTVLLAFGASKTTEMWKQLMKDMRVNRFPAQGEMIIAAACSITGSLLFGRRSRRWVTAIGTAGMASMFHNIERTLQAHADVNRQSVHIAGKRAGLIR